MAEHQKLPRLLLTRVMVRTAGRRHATRNNLKTCNKDLAVPERDCYAQGMHLRANLDRQHSRPRRMRYCRYAPLMLSASEQSIIAGAPLSLQALVPPGDPEMHHLLRTVFTCCLHTHRALQRRCSSSSSSDSNRSSNSSSRGSNRPVRASQHHPRLSRPAWRQSRP